MALQLYVGYGLRGVHVPFLATFAVQLCHWELWTMAGPIVWSFAARWPLGAGERWHSLARHAVAALGTTLAILAANLLLYHTLIRLPGASAWFAGFDRSLPATATFYAATYFHLELLIYAAVVATAHAVRTTTQLRAREREALRLEGELTSARLAVLRAQLQPHFLFNTLHTIGSLVLQQETDRATRLLAELGELLRGALAQRDADLAPLRDEIAYLRRYLTIEEARFGDRLRVEWDIEPGALDAWVPPFILQPLVENAFRHGISRRTEPSRLEVSAASRNGSLRVSIYNDGPGLVERGGGAGYGLTNVTARLETRQPAGRLELVNDGGGVRATLVMPFWHPA